MPLRKKAVLLTTTPATSEMEELVFALGADLWTTILQRRPHPDPQLFLGSGRMEEVRDAVRAAGVDVVIVNGQLKPGQVFGIQRFFADGPRRAGERDRPAIEVYDRTRLILEIFKERARSPEARLQVELAQLHYDMPLVKEAINLGKRGERQAGMFGGGEYEVNQLHDMMKKRMARIRRDLEKMRLERGVRRKHRRRGGFHLVSLAGYTNAGKSSLLQVLSQRRTLVENRYFSTLSTKTARAESEKREMLVTDTVGFIEDLPPWLVEAFHSTLEEIALADVILLVLDASDPLDEMRRRLRSSLRILAEFVGKEEATRARSGMPWATHHAPVLVALNKVDLPNAGDWRAKAAALVDESLLAEEQIVGVSAKTGDGLPDLFGKLYGLIPDYDEYEVALPPTPEAEQLIAWLHASTDVLDLTRGNEAHVHFEAKRSLRAELLSRLRAVGATPLREVARGLPGGDAGDAAKDEASGVDAASESGEANGGDPASAGKERMLDPNPLVSSEGVEGPGGRGPSA